MSIVHRVHILVVVLLGAMATAVSWAAAPATQPLPDAVDDGAFYEALRQRGLREWSQQSRQDVAPEDVVAATLARRETLLEQAARPGRSAEQARSDIVQASELLGKLIAEHREHPGRYRWQFELARDYLERRQPQAFEAMLLYELPGPDAKAARELAGRAVETLTVLRQQIAEAWKSVESLEEQGLAAARTSGTLAALETLDAQSSMLLTWGRLYAALANCLGDDDKDKDTGGQAASGTRASTGGQAASGTMASTGGRATSGTVAFAEVLDRVSKSGWLELPPGREPEQAGALVIAAIAERHLGRTKQADGHARQVIAVLNSVPDRATRQRMRRATLLGVLEQIRAARDAGQFDSGLTAAQQARQWCIKSRPDDTAALVAVSILESHLCHCKQAGKVAELRKSVGSWLQSVESLTPLDMLVRQSPAHRDLLYAVLAPCLRTVSGAIGGLSTRAAGSPATQLLAGAAVADAQSYVFSVNDSIVSHSSTSADGWGRDDSIGYRDLTKPQSSRPHPRSSENGAPIKNALNTDAQSAVSAGRNVDASHMQAAAKLARDALAAFDFANDAQTAGELRYLLGQTLAMQRARPEAIQVLTELAEKMPTHDRADAAARQAVNLAAEDVRNSGPIGSVASRATFVRAARILRQRGPTDAGAAELTYAIGVALENGGRYEEAAGEYASVPSGHVRWRDAALGRMRCWRQALEQVTATGTSVAADTSTLVDRARSAARAVRKQVEGESTLADVKARRTNSCEDGKLMLAVAELLNQPVLGGAEQAVDMLSDFEKRFVACPEMLGPVLRLRILALRQLKRLQEARAVLDRYLLTDPDNAGSAMAGLLQALHDEMLDGLKRGDKIAASASATEAVPLGRSLLDWVAARPGRMTPANVQVVQLWYAASQMQSGHPADALAVYESAERQDETARSSDSSVRIELRLGRADALLALDRTAEALPIYDRVWTQAVEASESWWHALTGSLSCHARDPRQVRQVLQSIRQQRYLFPDFDGGRYKYDLTQLERSLAASSTQPR